MVRSVPSPVCQLRSPTTATRSPGIEGAMDAGQQAAIGKREAKEDGAMAIRRGGRRDQEHCDNKPEPATTHGCSFEDVRKYYVCGALSIWEGAINQVSRCHKAAR